MNSIVIYDSVFGNTEKIARTIHNALAYYGPAGFILAGEISLMELPGVELVVLGCPTQDRAVTPTVADLLATAPPKALHGRTVAVFDTRLDAPLRRTGSAARHLAGEAKKLGGRLAVPAESFFVTGDQGPLGVHELRRASEWARALADGLTEG